MMNKIREMFENDSQVRCMRIQMDLLQRKGNYKEAMILGKNIDYLFSKVVQSYIEETEEEVEKTDLQSVKLPSESRTAVEVLCTTMFMACDIIETCVMNIDDEIKKVDKDLHMDMFDDIIELKKNAKLKLCYLAKNSEYMKDLMWGDKCDDMFDMMKNKVKSIMRHKHDANWGKNTEKFK